MRAERGGGGRGPCGECDTHPGPGPQALRPATRLRNPNNEDDQHPAGGRGRGRGEQPVSEVPDDDAICGAGFTGERDADGYANRAPETDALRCSCQIVLKVEHVSPFNCV